jgi:hypothetical protein
MRAEPPLVIPGFGGPEIIRAPLIDFTAAVDVPAHPEPANRLPPGLNPYRKDNPMSDPRRGQGVHGEYLEQVDVAVFEGRDDLGEALAAQSPENSDGPGGCGTAAFARYGVIWNRPRSTRLATATPLTGARGPRRARQCRRKPGLRPPTIAARPC